MAKRDKKVVVNEIYLRLIQRKATLLDEMAAGSESGLQVYPDHLKGLTKVYKDWDKAGAEYLEGDEPYTEPKK